MLGMSPKDNSWGQAQGTCPWTHRPSVVTNQFYKFCSRCTHLYCLLEDMWPSLANQSCFPSVRPQTLRMELEPAFTRKRRSRTSNLHPAKAWIRLCCKTFFGWSCLVLFFKIRLSWGTALLVFDLNAKIYCARPLFLWTQNWLKLILTSYTSQGK